MKRKRYTEPEIVFALQQAEAGTPVGEICRNMGGCGGHFLPLKEALRRVASRTPSLGCDRRAGCQSGRLRRSRALAEHMSRDRSSQLFPCCVKVYRGRLRARVPQQLLNHNYIRPASQQSA